MDTTNVGKDIDHKCLTLADNIDALECFEKDFCKDFNTKKCI